MAKASIAVPQNPLIEDTATDTISAARDVVRYISFTAASYTRDGCSKEATDGMIRMLDCAADALGHAIKQVEGGRHG